MKIALKSLKKQHSKNKTAEPHYKWFSCFINNTLNHPLTFKKRGRLIYHIGNPPLTYR